MFYFCRLVDFNSDWSLQLFYDLLKSDLEAMETTSVQTSKPMPHGSSLDDEDMERNEEIIKTERESKKQTQYGDTTAKELDNYIKNYTLPTGKSRTGLLAPVYDFVRNYQAMENLKLKESDKFFYCKANYEAASRGAYGALIAGLISVSREITDELRKGDSLEDIWNNSDTLELIRNRSHFKGKCGNCKFVNCCGGCRASSLYKYGELTNSDDNCFLGEIDE